MPELEQLFEIKDNLYKESAPVVIKNGVLLLDHESKCVIARITIKNICDKTISSLLVDIHVFDVANNEIEVLRDYQYFGLEAERDGEFGADVDISIISGTGKSFSVAVKHVTFSDDSEWNGTASLMYENIPARVTLLTELEDEATVEQYRRNFSNKIAKNSDVTAQYVPDTYKDLWLCSCGGINHKNEELCHVCKALFDPQKVMLDNRVQLAADLTKYNKAEEEKAEKARLEAERRAAEAKAAKEEAERRAAEAEAAAKEAERKRKIRNKTIAAISIPAAILAIIFVIVLVTYILPKQNYDAAVKLMNDGSYDEAVAAFTQLNGFSDSETEIFEAKYQKANSLFDEEKYDDAIVIYKEISDYKDSTDKISESDYLKASAVMKSGDYDSAIDMFAAVSGYKDAAEQIEQCWYLKGIAFIKAAELEKAKDCYSNVSGDIAVQMQEAFCDKGSEFYNSGDEKTALSYFDMVTDAAVLTSIDAVYYAKGKALVSSKEYDAALEIFNKIISYKKSAEFIQRIHYLKAEDLLNSNNYSDAIAEYEIAGEYEDAADKIKLCNYQIARSYYDSGKYQKAIKAFTKLGKYKDSATWVTESTYRYGLGLLNSGSVVEAYNVLYPIRSYDQAYSLLVSNSQFYIYVYDVGVGPNPEDEN
jgi:tetratricopeptide (TPR) repeat protein